MKTNVFADGSVFQTDHGDLVVLREVDRNKHGHRRFEFQCHCGNTFVAVGAMVSGGRTRSCRCIQRKTCAKNAQRKDPETVHANILFHQYRLTAKYRRIQFELTRADVLALMKSPCAYCGSAPCNRYHKVKRAVSRRGKACETTYDFVYSGIDRRDNAHGYTLGNSQPCCKWCNSAKSDRSERDFLDWAKRVTSYSQPVSGISGSS